MKVITIPKLDKYQHYKDRNIIWIKLYVDILHDYKFRQLRDSEKWLFVGLILLAVKNDNKIPSDFHYIAREILFSSQGLSEKMIKLHDLKLITIKRLSKHYQTAIPDKIREDNIRKENTSKNIYPNDELTLLKEKLKEKKYDFQRKSKSNP